MPLVPDPTSAAGLVVALLLLLGMPLAAVSAYLALRPVASTPWVRGVAAFGWACTGVAAASVAQGRLGAVVALILLPPIASALWLMATRRSTATTAFAASLAAVVLGAFVPVLLVVLAVIALLLALVRRGSRGHALTLAVVPLALLAPWIVRSAESSWTVLLAGVGLAQWGGATPEPWQLALLDPGGPGSALVWTSLPLVVVGVLALARGRSWRSPQVVLGLLMVVLLAATLVSPSVRLGTIPAGVEGTGDPITLWPGTFLLPLALVLVISLARGLDGIPLRAAAPVHDPAPISIPTAAEVLAAGPRRSPASRLTVRAGPARQHGQVDRGRPGLRCRARRRRRGGRSPRSAPISRRGRTLVLRSRSTRPRGRSPPAPCSSPRVTRVPATSSSAVRPPSS